MRRFAIKNDTLRKSFRQCEMLRGDEKEAKEHCQNFAAGTGYWQGAQLRVCGPHMAIIRRQKEMSDGRSGKHESGQAASPSGD